MHFEFWIHTVMSNQTRRKRVTFSSTTTYFIIKEDDSWINYRQPFWEIIARDRVRFGDRIKKMEGTLRPSLDKIKSGLS